MPAFAFDWSDFVAWVLVGAGAGFVYAWRRSDQLAQVSRAHALRVTPEYMRRRILAHAFELKLRTALVYGVIGAFAGGAVMTIFFFMAKIV
jgi:hypothetical protein